MTHIDMSVAASEVAPDVVPTLRLVGGVRPLENWLQTVSEAEEPCLLLDRDGVVLAASSTCHAVLGVVSARGGLVGRGLLEDVIDLIDFSAARTRLRPDEVERIPPLFALSTGALARGLMRIRSGTSTWTLDAIATPLRVGGSVLGSLTFFHRV
ncbi:hypothetical protein [Cryptosporangium aurantiacum]|uniref:PAS fold-containing protein n=1 Tax=Cryptosporangium aurantiacum TaxID=134849 RepID=A0A1M7RNW9_9ACTN|nr:hypothetical protein [Cryptosporangium aurantiacum]SHN47954.1 hypothetical protein SAMN05443668_1311 [Cryptosporangium aurantiacum]